MRIVFVTAMLLSIWLPAQEQQFKPKPTTQQSQQSPSPPAPATAPIQSKPETAPQQNSPNPKPSESLCDRLVDALISNWPLVGVGVLGILVAWLTLDDIRKQTINTALAVAAADKNAEAAILSAETIINAQRPWIVVESRPWKDTAMDGFYFYAINKGETPTEIVEAHFEQEFMTQIPDRFPVPPTYKTPILIPRRGDNLLIKDEDWLLRTIAPGPWIDGSGKRDAVDNAREWPTVFGQIVYRDTLRDRNDEAGLHYTRWCFIYSEALKVFIASGPPEYRERDNKQTRKKAN